MYKIATLYKFSRIQNPLKTHKDIRSNLKELSIKGTILVGEEGLNGTISATSEKKLSKRNKKTYFLWYRSNVQCQVRDTEGEGPCFSSAGG